MDKFAVILSGGKQYIAHEGKRLVVEHLAGNENDKVVFDKVVLTAHGEEEVHVGKPYLDKVTVEAKITKQDKGEKIRVARFRAKSRYRRVRGFRSMLTEVEIVKISLSRKT